MQTISEQSKYVETSDAQTTGAFSEILRIDPSKKQGGIWFGVKPNPKLLLRMVQTDGTQLGADTKIRVGLITPNSNPRYFTQEDLLYEPWYYLNEAESFGKQQDEDMDENLILRFEKPQGVAVKENEYLIVEVKADNAIDWSPNSSDSNFILQVEKGTGKPPQMK